MSKIGTISEETIERIKQENNIREVAAEYGIRIGHNNKARCPFHSEGRTPNLHFYEDSYHCYTCKAGTKWENKEKKTPHSLKLPDGKTIEDGGPSVIGFVMNLERCSYVEACVILMERAGIPVPKAKIDHKLEKQKRKTHAMNIEFCKALISNPEMRVYLSKRGIKEESIKTFRLGWVPDGFRHPIFKGRVEGRLVFGLPEDSWDAKKARTTAMAYRAMDEEQEADGKYLNDPTSEVYSKSGFLYAFNEARKAIRENGYAIVMEGYVDVILAHQAHVQNAVGTCGTAFTDEQMDKLRKLTDKIVFWYDGDPAGMNAMLSDIERLMAKGFRVFVIDSTPNDPAEIINLLNQDRDRVLKYIADKSVPALQMILRGVVDDFERDTAAANNLIIRKKTEALDQLMPVFESITDPSEKVMFKTMISEKIGVSI
ncbi:toprim domain-containing protein (plasmid) [Paenibacillus sp. EC2-1]|uniref:toprim domain-containing protein n=1 Tax=Paenibacillus sp. EC2-1 TaxID=3388665 RepID=UPI003BEEBEEC